jgi:hypothetical protein
MRAGVATVVRKGKGYTVALACLDLNNIYIDFSNLLKGAPARRRSSPVFIGYFIEYASFFRLYT